MKCAKCGKEFEIGPQGWGYAYKRFYTCSYKCMREMEKEGSKVSECLPAKRIMTDEDRAKIDEMAAQGFDNGAIAEALDLSKGQVGVYLGSKKRGAAQREAAQKKAMTAQTAQEQPKAERVTMPQILADIGKEVPECDELTRMVVRLMADMVAILKRIV